MTTPPIMTINDELLAELEQLAIPATKGKWCTDGDTWVCAQDSDQLNNGFVLAICEGPDERKNAEYIAAANPTTILALLQHVRELKVDNLRMRSALDQLSRTPGCGCSFPCRCGGDEWTKAELEGRMDIASYALAHCSSAD